MQPTFVQKDPILLMGMSFYGDPFQVSGDWSAENEIGRLWQRFMGYLEQNRAALQPLIAGQADYYEVHIYNPETPQKGFFEVFTGVAVQDTQRVPLDLLVKVLPATQYAVFTLKGEQITSDWYQDLEAILAQKGCARSHPFIVELYDQRFKGLDQLADSELDVYIPVAAVS